MKATESKYLALLDALDASPAPTTQSELARAADIPPSLANRYLRRLAAWGALAPTNGAAGKYALTEHGALLLRRASWELLDSLAAWLERHHARTVAELRARRLLLRSNRLVLYGATPLAGVLGDWAVEAGFEVHAVCDEERDTWRGTPTVRSESLADLAPAAILLCDHSRAADRLLIRLLERYAPVINPFAVDGRARPEWKESSHA